MPSPPYFFTFRPAHTTGPVAVTATTDGGTTAPLTYTFEVGSLVSPVASSIAPTNGPDTGGTTVTLTGSGFVPDQTTITIGTTPIPASGVSVANDGHSLTFITPACVGPRRCHGHHRRLHHR